MKNTILLLLNVVALSPTHARDDLVVTLPEGQIRGHVLRADSGNDYYAYQQIPYATPPVGKLRFQAPLPPQKWKGILNTVENTKICIQGGLGPTDEGAVQTEDCLYLNVYSPQEPGRCPKNPTPVLVWTHGGAFLYGSGVFQYYKPQYFVEHGVVLVTLNYRVGALGFLSTEDGVIPGNIGLKDQHLALQWVKKNIHLFCGDPEKITIYGESAGGTSVGLQLVSLRNKGLFRAAILSSGSALCQWSHQDYARFYAFELGRSLDPTFNSSDSRQLLALLQRVPASDINVNTITTPAVGKETGLVEGDGLIWIPVIENKNLKDAFLTDPSHEAVRTGNINHVPILIGFNSEEELYFMNQDPSSLQRRATLWDKDVSSLIRNKFKMSQANKSAAGKKLRQLYTKGLFKDDLAAVVKFSSDEAYTIPLIRHAKLQSRYTDVFLYQFSYKGNMGGMINAEIAGVRGVGHGEDNSYFWHFSNKDGTKDSPEDLRTSQRLLTMWTNFAKYLNPTPTKDSLLDNVIWEKVSPNKLIYLNINNTLHMEQNPRKYLKWEEIIDPLAIPPLYNY